MSLSHEERSRLAHRVATILVARHRVCLVGVYGSTARGTDTLWSDLELLAIVQDDEPIRDIAFLYQGIAVGIVAHHRVDLERLITHPDSHWPMLMGILSSIQVLYGDLELVSHWLEMGRTTPAPAFRTALEHLAPALVFESCGRILSCALRNNPDDLASAIIETVLEMNTALCLLNQRWTSHDYYAGVLDVMEFPILPVGYAELAPALWHSRDPSQAAELAKVLLGQYVALLRQNGIALNDWAALPIEEWPL